jgi:hypothetical protein
VGQVQTALQRRVQWTVSLDQRQWLCEVLATLEFHPQAARAYAATVVAREQLPPDAKAALKQAQAKPFLLEAMKGKPTTASQMWRLRHEGYTGPIPADRAAASELLATILQTKGGA